MIDLYADLTLHVDPAGSDTTGDGSAAHPFQNPQAAWDALQANYNLRGHAATIQLATLPASSGSGYFYKGLFASGRITGQAGLGVPLLNAPGKPPFYIGKAGAVTLRGDPGYARGAFIYPSATDRGECISMSEGTSLTVDGITMDTALSNKDCINVFNGAFLNLQNILFGNAGQPPSSFNNHISIAFGGTVWISGGITVSGSAASFVTVGSNSALYFNNNGDPGLQMQVTVVGNPAWRDGFIQVDNGICYAMAVTFSGAATGPRYRVLRNGVLDTNTGNVNLLPGNQAGALVMGGVYN